MFYINSDTVLYLTEAGNVMAALAVANGQALDGTLQSPRFLPLVSRIIIGTHFIFDYSKKRIRKC